MTSDFLSDNCGFASRQGCQFNAHVAQQQRHDVESVASAGANPAMSTILGPKLRQRSSRLLTGIAGCMSLWTDHFRLLVKQHHVWLTSRNRGGSTFTGDHF